MRDVRTFGTDEWPLRPSSIGKLKRCPMSVVLDEGGEGNSGAQTGSLTHEGVQAFHRTLSDKEALAAVIAAQPRFPAGDAAKAQRWVAAYAADPTHRQATVTHCEHKVSLRLGSVVIAGTLDQIRLGNDGVHRVWDVKTGSYLSPQETLDEYQVQQAAYVLAARETLGLDVRPGGIIRIAAYDKGMPRPMLPFTESGDALTMEEAEARGGFMTLGTCRLLLDGVEDTVRLIRSGERVFSPGASTCKFCPARHFPKCAH